MRAGSPVKSPKNCRSIAYGFGVFVFLLLATVCFVHELGKPTPERLGPLPFVVIATMVFCYYRTEHVSGIIRFLLALSVAVSVAGAIGLPILALGPLSKPDTTRMLASMPLVVGMFTLSYNLYRDVNDRKTHALRYIERFNDPKMRDLKVEAELFWRDHDPKAGGRGWDPILEKFVDPASGLSPAEARGLWSILGYLNYLTEVAIVDRKHFAERKVLQPFFAGLMREAAKGYEGFLTALDKKSKGTPYRPYAPLVDFFREEQLLKSGSQP